MSLMIDDAGFTQDEPVEPGSLHAVGRPPVAVDAEGATLEAFVVEHYDRLVRLARLICHDVADTTDAVQSGIEQAWRHRRDLREPDRQRAWLDRIVVREAIRVSRRRRDRLEWLLGIEHEGPSLLDLPEAGPDMDVRIVLDGAFARLSPEQRAVVGLHLYAGYPVADTAEIVGAPIETVRSRLRVARERLRDALGETSR